jgi:hypothetical protein
MHPAWETKQLLQPDGRSPGWQHGLVLDSMRRRLPLKALGLVPPYQRLKLYRAPSSSQLDPR